MDNNTVPSFKNLLQELLQKAGVKLPLYQSKNEGSPHEPKFRACVVIGKKRYISRATFRDLKSAEQDAARVAYEAVQKSNLVQVETSIHQEPLFTKSILYEYCVKKNLETPTYQTLPEGGSSAKPSFISSVTIRGMTFTAVAASKKVAEQLAAKEAVQSLFVFDSATLHPVIKSKERMYSSVFEKVSGMKRRAEGNP